MGLQWAEFTLGLGLPFGASNSGSPFTWGDKGVFT